jgi:hypothetical protein
MVNLQLQISTFFSFCFSSSKKFLFFFGATTVHGYRRDLTRAYASLTAPLYLASACRLRRTRMEWLAVYARGENRTQLAVSVPVCWESKKGHWALRGARGFFLAVWMVLAFFSFWSGTFSSEGEKRVVWVDLCD